MRSIDHELVEKDRLVEPKPLRDTVGDGDEVDDDGREMLVLEEDEPLKLVLRETVVRLTGVRAESTASATKDAAVRPIVLPVPVE
jgi:hypothetical protein